MNTALKNWILRTARAGGLFSLNRRRTRGSLRILAYHGVDDIRGPVNGDAFFVSPSVFEAQLDDVGRRFRFLPLDEAAACVREGRPWPERAVMVTFDDGYLDNLEQAAPVLRRKGIPAVFFVTTGFIDGSCYPWWIALRGWIAGAGHAKAGSPPGAEGPPPANSTRCIVMWEHYLKGLTAAERNRAMDELGARLGRERERPVSMMNWDQVRALQAAGFDVAPHTMTHINLGAETEETVTAEITGSIDRLHAMCGTVSPAYSYPYGRGTDIQPSVLRVLRDRNCAVGVTTVPGFNPPGGDPLLMKRLNVTGVHRGLILEKLLSAG